MELVAVAVAGGGARRGGRTGGGWDVPAGIFLPAGISLLGGIARGASPPQEPPRPGSPPPWSPVAVRGPRSPTLLGAGGKNPGQKAWEGEFQMKVIYVVCV